MPTMMPPTLHLPLLDATTADLFFQRLLAEGNWRQYQLNLYGRTVTEPRLIDWAGAVTYRYSGRVLEPRPLSPLLCSLREQVERTLGMRFNHVLINRYRDGNDYMGWHRDNEPELGSDPTIASLSLGQARPFQMRTLAKTDPHEWLLESGSLFVMQPGCQRYWQHQLPKRALSRIPGERINLTFRQVQT
ncbi:alpha-ketoglutarate-dependent dioxygenase AlkB [Litorivicinus lipolyticus]|uniref:Alpha-ketoglutarate-dependent dioxygenase AlkB n=2 Tax=Litorivicinus lipolyticus TaxID=418701 RepID=A0A5Q2QBM8_9GAMM|nr:alpha-ketoglutarate-dependent dioxygenase AlkB [Litorivicinus lipolyticus]